MKRWLIALGVALAVIVGSAAALHTWYMQSLRPVSSATSISYFTINRGSGVRLIAVGLHQAGLIRNVSAFETYISANNWRDKLQAGTYKLSPSMSTQTIAAKLSRGDIARNLLTILPGKRLDQIRQAFKDAGYSQSEVDAAFDPANYIGHPALASLPAGTSLEGYLYPDSFDKTNAPATTIVRESLDEMQKYLSADIANALAAKGLNVFQGITLASIILKETDNPADQPIVAQVILSRLAQNMALQADATAFYAADISLLPHSLSIDSPYNTYLHTGLPPGPISNLTKDALNAAAHPARTDYLYYVTGDNGKTYFEHTAQEHQADVEKYCQKACRQ